MATEVTIYAEGQNDEIKAAINSLSITTGVYIAKINGEVYIITW